MFHCFIASLLPYFIASFLAGRVARSAALVSELPFAKGIKRGGACLFAHGYSSSDAIRATRRGIGRCS
jgi:hypothetical protein